MDKLYALKSQIKGENNHAENTHKQIPKTMLPSFLSILLNSRPSNHNRDYVPQAFHCAIRLLLMLLHHAIILKTIKGSPHVIN